MKRSRILLAVVTAVLALFALAGTAYAEPPLVPQPSIKLAAANPSGKGYCPFPVRIDQSSGQTITTSTGPNGETIYKFTGSAVATVTNLKTGEQLTYNISGPGTVVVNPDGSFSGDAGGANLLYTTVANSYPGVPQLAYTTGHVQFTVDASGKTTSYSLSGSSTDVCAALA
jgi:hypothetical protein